MSKCEKIVEDTYATYMELLANYYTNVYTSQRMQRTLTILHASGRLTAAEYISYIPCMVAKLEMLAKLLQHDLQADLRDFSRL